MARKRINSEELEIRKDSIRITPSYDKKLETIKAKTKLKTNSELWRHALDTYDEYSSIVDEFKSLKNEVSVLKEMIEDLNFYMRAKLK